MMLFSKKVVLVTLSLGATVMSGRVLAANLNLNRARTPKTEIKTSNGETPAPTKETMCDEYKEEDEVYGLCIAYCKAKNCHETESDNPSCVKLKEDYVRLTNMENLPCESTNPPNPNPNADAEDPDGDALRAKYEGSVTLGNLDCGSGTDEEYTACVQSAQNALKTALEEIICKDLTPPLVPPCWVVVDPNPQTEGVTVTVDEAGRRRLDLLSLWEFIASITIEGDTIQDQATIESASAAILDVATDLAAAVWEDIEVIVAGVVAAFEVLAVELSPDPYEWVAIIPSVTGYQLVGEGYCTSSLGEYYGGIQYYASSVQDCVAKCKASVCFPENGWTLVGVELEDSDCYCLDNEVGVVGGSCSDSDADFGFINFGTGTGQPWFSGPEGQDDGVLCFRFI